MRIFNAVLCSAGWFFAEDLREHYVEIKRERQYMISLVADPKDDNQLLTEGRVFLPPGVCYVKGNLS